MPQIKRHRLELVISILERENFMSTDLDPAALSHINGSQSPYFSPLETPQSLPTPSSSGGSNSLPSQLPRSLTRSAGSQVSSANLSLSDSRSSTTSPARPISASGGKDSRASSLSRSRPSLSELTSPASESGDPAGLSPAFESPVFEEQGLDTLRDEQPRSFEKMQESMLSDSSTASGIVDNITLLPDEIVCVGLSMQQEYAWRARIVHALFYPEDVLPPKQTKNAAGKGNNETYDGEHLDASQEFDSRGTSRQSQINLYSTTPTPQRPVMSLESRNTPARSFSASTNGSRSQSLFNATEDADYPVGIDYICMMRVRFLI